MKMVFIVNAIAAAGCIYHGQFLTLVWVCVASFWAYLYYRKTA